MHKKWVALFIFILCSYAHASPWFTGPLLAPSGENVPIGHFDVEIYGFSTHDSATFNRNWKLTSTPTVDGEQAIPVFNYGITNDIDTQFSVPYSENKSEGRKGQHIGDTSILLGFQTYRQKPGHWLPNLRLTIQEIFPTGRFNNLNPIDKGVGATGTGSYETILGTNFEHLQAITETHYLRTRLSLSYLLAAPANIRGESVHGGTIKTQGTIIPGNLFNADLAGELTLTQNWVGVMEVYYIQRQASKFSGVSGLDQNSTIARLGHDELEEISLAPAIEYNFSQNYGIIAGVWFAVRGKSAPDFVSTVIAFNAFW